MSNRLRHFLRQEPGAITVFGLLAFVAIFAVAALVIDLARHELLRIQLQGLADRAVLAAANMRRAGDGDISPESHVRAYFLAAGLSPAQVASLDIQVGGTSPTERTVTVRPNGSITSLLGRWYGVDRFPLATPAEAQVRRPLPLDVVLVLDVSYSMSVVSQNGLSRIENLRLAAADLVRDLMEDREPGDVAITIVPYDTWVVPPPTLGAYMSDLREPASGPAGGSAHCFDFLDFPQIRSGAHSPLADSRNRPVERRNCGPLFGFRVVRPAMTDFDAIIAHLESLQPIGSTSIDLGVRFGAMFFDPSLAGFIDERIEAGEVSALLRQRPGGLTPAPDQVTRVMVLMTDGENCCGLRGTPDDMDQNTAAVCDAMRTDGILVYTVAFEAPERGRDLLTACASSPSHAFITDGSGLRATFQAIGRQVAAANLRLVR